MLSEWTLTNILSRVQILQTKKIYNYNRLESINSKPALQRGGENLIEYNLSLQLHINFCNPSKIIEMIEERAKTGESIDWVFNRKYMGEYIITSVEKSVQKHIKGNIIYAEIVFNMLENPVDEEFEEQSETNPDLSNVDKYSENSNKVKDFAVKVKNSVMKNLKDAVATSVISENLSDAAKEIYSSVTSGVISDMTGGNIANIYNTISNYKNIINGSVNLNFSDVKELVDAVSEISNLVMNSSLRGSVTS